MKLKIKMDLDNAAFDMESDGERSGVEIARVLRGLASDVDRAAVCAAEVFQLRDINGNRIGTATVKA